MPQNAAGARVEPPVSLPMAISHIPSATATAAPEEEPPGSLDVALKLAEESESSLPGFPGRRLRHRQHGCPGSGQVSSDVVPRFGGPI
jgi:hypothetical protein